MALNVETVADLTDEERAAVGELSRLVYPAEEWVDWPGWQIEWAAPQWCIRVRGEDGALLSYVGIYLCDALCDDRLVKVGGIGNVKTDPAHRGLGLASGCIQRAIEFIRAEPGVEFAVLVCEPSLIGYYARLGWQVFTGQLLVRQHGVATPFTLCRVMTHAIGREAPTTGIVDLCSPPW